VGGSGGVALVAVQAKSPGSGCCGPGQGRLLPETRPDEATRQIKPGPVSIQNLGISTKKTGARCHPMGIP
jgi:hypothetical protein